MEEEPSLKENFEEVTKFERFYSNDQDIFLSHDGENVICGNTKEEAVEINILDKEGRKVSSLDNFSDTVVKFVVSHHNSTLILATKSSLLQLWNWKTGKVIRAWKSGHRHLVSAMALCPRGRRLATGSSDRRLRLWSLTPSDTVPDDFAPLLVRAAAAGADLPTLAKFHPSRSLLVFATRGDSVLRTVDADSGDGRGELSGHVGEVTAVEFGPSGEMISCCQGRLAVVWDLQRMTALLSVPVQERLTSCMFVADPQSFLKKKAQGGPHFLTGGSTGILRLWRADKAQCVMEVQRAGLKMAAEEEKKEEQEQEEEYSLKSVVRIVSGPGDHYLVVRASASIEFYRRDEVKVDREVVADVGEVRRIVFCGADGRCLAVMAGASSQLLLYPRLLASPPAWDALAVETGHRQPVTDVAVSPDGRRLLTGSKDRSLRLWEATAGPDGAVSGLRLLAEGKGHTAHVSAVAFDREGARGFSAGEEVDLFLWRLPRGPGGKMELVSCVSGAHRLVVNCIAVGPRNRLLATGSRDKTVKIWTITQNDLIEKGQLTGHSRGIWSVAFSPLNQRLLSASGDGTLKLWSLDDFQCLATFDQDGGPVYQAIFLSRGQQFLSSDKSGQVVLTTVRGQQTVQKMCAHEGRVWTAAVGGGEAWLATGGEGGDLALWRDVSDEERERKQKEVVEALEVEDKVRNLLHAGKLHKALLFVIKADKPMKAYKIIRDLRLQSPETLRAAVHDILDHPQDLVRLLRYCAAWTQHNQRYTDARAVLAQLLSSRRPQQLAAAATAAGEDPQRLFGALVPHLQRHRRREARFARAAMFVPFVQGLAGELEAPMEM